MVGLGGKRGWGKRRGYLHNINLCLLNSLGKSHAYRLVSSKALKELDALRGTKVNWPDEKSIGTKVKWSDEKLAVRKIALKRPARII